MIQTSRAMFMQLGAGKQPIVGKLRQTPKKELAEGQS